MKKLSGFPLFKISMAVIFLVTSTGQASAAPQPTSEVLSASTIAHNSSAMESRSSQLQQENSLLYLNRFQFDPLLGEPEIPPEQLTTYAPGEEGFHLVQFIGPPEDSWLDELRANGVVIIQGQPSHAYIVRMTPEEVAFVGGQGFVRWVGVYHAAYRIAPSLLQTPTPVIQQQIIQNVDVTIYNNGQVTETIEAIKRLGGELIQQFSAMPDESLITAIYALPSEAVVAVAQLNTILWMNFSSPEPGLLDEMSDQISVGNFNAAGVPFTGYNAWLTATGVNGSGVQIAIVDTGVDYNHPDLNIVAGVSYDGQVPAGNACLIGSGRGHGTHVAGISAGNASTGITDPGGFLWGLGVAPSSGIITQNALCAPTWPPGADPANPASAGWPRLSRDSVMNGAVVSNNSWFTGLIAQGYSMATRQHDVAVRDADILTTGTAEPLIMVFAAGNFGPGASSLAEPQEAKNLITVANSHNSRALDVFDNNPNRIGNINAVLTNCPFFSCNSSRGPALDGRLLPNIAAPGTQIVSARNDTGGACTTSPVAGAGAAFYSFCTGTSMAAPHVAGGVALITEWWRTFNTGANPSPAMAKALLINGAVGMTDEDDDPGTADIPIPNNIEGWGRMDLNNVINAPVPVIYHDQTKIFGANGEMFTLQVSPADPTQPLKVTLVWSDAPAPGSGGATRALLNNLDLSVIQGTNTFLGNFFTSGWSTLGGVADTLNNVENVYIQSPSGVYDITVTATEFLGDGVPYNADLTDQDFALVCYNCSSPADLSITKSGSPDPVVAGGTLTYSLTVTNNGPSDATNVTITDILPAGVAFDPATSSPSCTGITIVTCVLGNLATGASATVTITVTIDPTTPTGAINNTANVTGNEVDPDTTNNTASAATDVLSMCTILDDFNRPNGPLGSNWDGRTNGYRIVSNEVVVRRGGPIYWQPEAYGSDQEACVTLTRINPRGRQHALLLKVQELNDWRQGAILVSYNARSGKVEVEARDVATKKWNLVGSFTTPVVDGDQLRAQAFADGTVEVFINDTSIGTSDAGSFYVDKGGQIGLWFLGRQRDDENHGDNDRESLLQARERNSNGADEHEGDDDDSSAARRAILDDFGGGTIITTPTLTQISSDPYTNTTSQHKTEVEPDSFSYGSTIVSVQQSGRFFAGGASNICWSTLNNATLVANGCLPGITKFASPAGIFDRVSDPVVAFDAKHGVWLVSTLAVTETPSLIGKAVLSSRSTDATATVWNNPVVVSEATGSSFYDKNWIVCDNTPASPFYGNCYTQWDDNGLGNMLQMSTSNDGGLTWGPKKKVGIGGNTFHGFGGQPVVQPNGTVIVPYRNNSGSQILAFLSTDGGTSWGDAFVVSNVSFHDPGGNLRSLALPSAEIDSAGRVYVVWSDCRFRTGCTSNDIVMSTSTDGMSWTSAIRVPIGTTTDGADNFIPGIAVDNTTSGATAKVAITYYYYPVASCTFATCQLHVGFVSSPDGGASWTGVTTLAGPMALSWLPDTSQGRMVGDYISTSYGSDGLAHSVFIVAKEPTGNPDCAIATPNCDVATYTTSSGLALLAMSNASETLIAAEVGVAQPPVRLNTDENVPDQSNLTLY